MQVTQIIFPATEFSPFEILLPLSPFGDESICAFNAVKMKQMESARRRRCNKLHPASAARSKPLKQNVPGLAVGRLMPAERLID